ncbi:hypothetical protein AGMMS49928_06870 [Spirochaetia bacterium]|nr:hypothetical protein AGMMS49928_06870 [Spirochaetia bacterium]
MTKLIILALALGLVNPCQTQSNVNNLLTLDLGYSLNGLLNQGWGIGFSFEKKITGYLSVKGTFGHMTFLTGIPGVYCTTIDISSFLNYYPLGNGLDKLYAGIGCSTDFLNYFGDGELPGDTGDTVISLIPKAGWKWRALKRLMIDVSIGYKFGIVDADNYKDTDYFLPGGLQYGVNFKLFLNGNL